MANSEGVTFFAGHTSSRGSKSVVITGVSSGIGYATAKALVQKGYHVFGRYLWCCMSPTAAWMCLCYGTLMCNAAIRAVHKIEEDAEFNFASMKGQSKL